MMDPEYYVGAYRQQHGLWQTRKYSDAPPEAISEDAETVIWTRKPLYCCKIPGEAEWCSTRVDASRKQDSPMPQGIEASHVFSTTHTLIGSGSATEHAVDELH